MTDDSPEYHAFVKEIIACVMRDLRRRGWLDPPAPEMQGVTYEPDDPDKVEAIFVLVTFSRERAPARRYRWDLNRPGVLITPEREIGLMVGEV